MQLLATPDYPPRDPRYHNIEALWPRYHQIETMRPSIEVDGEHPSIVPNSLYIQTYLTSALNPAYINPFRAPLNL